MELSLKKRVYKRMTMSVKCMVFHNNNILLLQKKDREGLLPWEFPGGGLEFGEDLHKAAIREVKEETGLSVEILDIAGLWSFQRSESVFLTGVIFIGVASTADVVISEEHTAYAWVKPEALHQYTLQDSLKEALRQIRLPDEQGSYLRSYFVQHVKC